MHLRFQASVDAAHKVNKEKNEPGQVCCAKMRMMAAAPYTQGFLNVSHRDPTSINASCSSLAFQFKHLC